MALRRSHRHPVRRLAAGAGVAMLLSVGLACGGDSDTDPTTPTTPTTVPATDVTLPVKNMPLNNCVSVMSGERPPPGATIPRCKPTGTIAPRPPKK
jgi:hypothetical protein